MTQEIKEEEKTPSGNVLIVYLWEHHPIALLRADHKNLHVVNQIIAALPLKVEFVRDASDQYNKCQQKCDQIDRKLTN